ncbi:OLC1v1015764C1 [Oldenlandia corymbosa var. corymbosa]|uniref:OLC1v1015764C1 n=1 Tax=Oldenlandia corymbosa var. corymbosa TaxID=529605 RepID=A0AAV1E412_OLDCO|nr:OLC1v1015764C1 [Oldenlandia corymbosa var. corymbosa]
MAAVEDPPPRDDEFIEGTVDFKGCLVKKSNSGKWRSALFIIGVEMAERFAYYGISANLISYLTGPLGQSTAKAAENVNAWSGAAMLLPLLGAFVADSYLGRYRAIIIASLLYILGLGLLTLSAALPSFKSSDCEKVAGATPCSPPKLQMILFFGSLYLVALAQGGHKPCVQAFGADQFDGNDPKESKAKSSFFNWWYFGVCLAVTVTLVVLTYIQDNLSWGIGFGIPCVLMAIALIIFSLGTVTYRFAVNDGKQSPFMRISRVFVNAAKNWRTNSSTLHNDQGSQQFKFLNKALVTPNASKEEKSSCSLNDVEDAKALFRLVPIWISCLVYGIVYAQSSTFFTKQGVTMNRSISSTFKVPPASLLAFISTTIVVFIPIYDRIIVPIARAITRKPSGITMLQRIGTGLFISILSMSTAALVEMKRLETARNHGLIDKPKETVPMSVAWLIPQYLLLGVSESLTLVGLQEFFYDQMARELRSTGLALFLSIFGIGSFLNTFLISVIDKNTSRDGHESWFSNNLNKAHLDYFYWLLAGLSVLALIAYLYFAKCYIYYRCKN